ncbi:hypothetical protein V1227_08850 [Lentzea sp. DG1S-22]|uniref:hypothetical protein n=1 Tax=Lentzea sp. DG1S-22 TaxID=3108822 RepID=UPI002E778198|nr:hypothetical protein [Lentzea sp. DG1S-22]WVH82840.1 hypothetical protein V1227_08850 [Lentzea sp. DG1S-22]
MKAAASKWFSPVEVADRKVIRLGQHIMGSNRSGLRWVKASVEQVMRDYSSCTRSRLDVIVSTDQTVAASAVDDPLATGDNDKSHHGGSQ